MSEFIESKIEEIVGDKSYPEPLNHAMAATWILANLKGFNLKLLDVKEMSSLTDFFIIVSASNPTQASSMAEAVPRFLKRYRKSPISREGSSESLWTLIDYGDFIIHIFLESARELYDLDEIWIKAPQVKIPEDYYFDEGPKGQEGPEGYF